MRDSGGGYLIIIRMSRKFEVFESLQSVYPPQVATADTTWAYTHSFNVRPFDQQDLDGANYRIGGPQVHGGRQIEGNANSGQSHGAHKGGKKEPIDRFASIIDAEDPRFEKQRRENQRVLEQGVQNLSACLTRSTDAFFDRKTEVYHNIVYQATIRREEANPQVDPNEITDEIKELAIAPWIFQTLPGTKISQWSDPSQLTSLVERMDQLSACSLWCEPLDVSCGGPEFFQQAHQFIKDTSEQLNLCQDVQNLNQELVNKQANAVSVVFGMSVLMASHEKIIDSLDMLHQFSQSCKHSELVFKQAEPRFKRYLKQMVDVVDGQKQLHYLQSNSIHGVIAMAKYVSIVNLNENTSSLTTDGSYLYLSITAPQRGCLFKIGTGEKNTIAGCVYQIVPTEREGEITWVYCQGKLYSRRANEELGQIVIYNPQTLKQEGIAKLFCEEAFSSPVAQSLNRYYPLLSDGKSLYVITMNISKKRRRVKEGMRKQYQTFQEDKKRQTEESKKEQVSAQQPVEAKPPSKKEPGPRKPKKDKKEAIQDELSKFECYLEMDHKEKNEQKVREQKKNKASLKKSEVLLKKAQEAKVKESAPAGGAGEESKEVQQVLDPDQYKVCEFYLHEFDVENQDNDEVSVKQLLTNELVVEIFESFSGYFSLQECNRALKFKNNDPAEAAAWLVDEGEKERVKKSLLKKKSILLGESEILSENQSKKNEVDILVKPDSVLYPTNVTTGKWTINATNVSFHNLTADNGYIKVFSTLEKDLQVINGTQEAIKPTVFTYKASGMNESEYLGSSSISPRRENDELRPQESVMSESESLADSQNTDSVANDINSDTLKEEDMLEEIKLYGTLLKTVKLQKSSDFNRTSYLTYDNTYSKFYFLIYGSNHRFIAVADDLTNMFKSVEETFETMNDSESKNIGEFVMQTLSVLNKISLKRFNMPWKWTPWSINFQQALNHQSADIDLGGDASQQEERSIVEQKKKIVHKLTQRLEKVSLKEKSDLRRSLNIEYDEKLAIGTKGLTQQTKKKDHPKEVQPNQPSTWGVFAYGLNQAPYKRFGQDGILPAEKIHYQKEIKKIFALNASGNANTLRSLLRLLEIPHHKYRLQVLRQLLDWTFYADIMIHKTDPQIITQTYNQLLNFINTDNVQGLSEEEYLLIWRILIIGWHIYAKNTQLTIQLMSLVIKHSIEVYPKMFAQTEKLPKQKDKLTFFELLKYSVCSPIQLFRIRFFKNPSAFYPLEVLLQTKVTNNILLIDKKEWMTDDKIVSDHAQCQPMHAVSPRFEKFRGPYDQIAFEGFRQIPMVSLKGVKELHEREVNIGNVDPAFYSVPLVTMFMGPFEMLEDLQTKQSINPVRYLRIYTESEVFIDEEINQDADHQKLLHQAHIKALHQARQDHSEKSQALINTFYRHFLDFIQENCPYSTSSIYLNLMAVFNELLAQSLQLIDWSRQKTSSIALKHLAFIDEAFLLMSKKTSGFKQSMTPTQLDTLLLLKDILNTIVNGSYLAVDYAAHATFAKDSLPYLLRIIETVKSLFNIESDNAKQESLLEKGYVLLSEGTDFTYEKVFETQHPYPRTDVPMKETIHVPKAIAFSVELDKRCQTENNQDYLLLQSADHAFWVNDSFGTYIKFYGKPAAQHPFMILGNKMSIEFRSFSHGKKSSSRSRERGRGGGFVTGRNNEDAQDRWGFRVIIRPIFGEPPHYLDSKVKRELVMQVSQRIGGEAQIASLVPLMNQLFFTVSIFSRALITASIDVGDSLNVQAVKQDTEKQNHYGKYVKWHLFKGGVKTHLLDEIQNPLVFNQVCAENENTREQEAVERHKKLEVYRDTQQKAEKKSENFQNPVDGDKIEVQAKFEPQVEYWTPEVARLVEDSKMLEELIAKIRELVPYTMAYKNEKRRPNFTEELQDEWAKLEQVIVVAMLYHSNSIDEAKRFLNKSQSGTNDQIEEMFKLIGSQVNEVLAWMQSRLQGEQEFQNMVRDVIERSQSFVEKVIIRKKEEEEERQKQLEAKKVADEEAKRKVEKLLEEEKESSQKKGPVVSKSKPVKHAKRKNVIKQAVQAVDISKLKDKSKKKKEVKHAVKEDQPSVVNQELGQEPSSKEINEKQIQTKYLEVPKHEEQEIKNKIYNQVYEDFLQLYQGNQDRVKPLCLLLNIQFNPEDPNESLKAIFKRLKNKIKPLMDFDGPMQIREKITFEELKLESPYKEICKDVKGRMLFLLELKPSIDFHSKVLHIDFAKIAKKRRIIPSSTSLALLSEAEEEVSQHIMTESSIHGDDDSDILEPLGPQRSQSVQVGLQPSLQGIAGVSQAVIAAQNNMREEDIVNWIDNYRKWRQWNRQHSLIHKQSGMNAGLELFEEDLTSPFCSPLYSVVSFAKASKITNVKNLGQLLISHQVIAAFRILGLNVLEKLGILTHNTPFERLIWGNISLTLQDSSQHSIESCGSSLTQHINESCRQIVKQLMNKVIQCRRSIDRFLFKKLQKHNQDLAAAQSQSQSRMYLTQAEKLKQETAFIQQSKVTAQFEEWRLYEQMKRLFQTLNDIRVLLQNSYTREYVLESVRQTQARATTLQDLKDKRPSNEGDKDEQKQLTFETLLSFLKSLVILKIFSSSSHQIQKTQHQSLTKMQFSIAHCCKLVLIQFMTDRSLMRSTETQRLLQEILLDIVVELLEKHCGIASSKTRSNEEKDQRMQQRHRRLGRSHHQEELVQLLKMLSEVIRISNDHQQQLQTIQYWVNESIKDTYFLSEGSDKVMRCAQILAYLMHNVEIPAVIRQTIKCAKLFFKLVDFKKLQLHSPSILSEEAKEGSLVKATENQFLLETLKQIGSKIGNIIVEEKQEKNEEEKLYVVYGNVNSSEEDYSFLITALYHWENMYPTFTLEQPKDPAEIVVKAKPKEEVKKEEEGSVQPEQESQADKLLARMQAAAQDNVDLQELINIQKRQKDLHRDSRGFRGRGGGPAGSGRGGYQGYESYSKGKSNLFERAPSQLESRYGGPSQYKPGSIAQVIMKQPIGKPSNEMSKSQFTSIFQYSKGHTSLSVMNQISISKLDLLFEEIIKVTWDDCKEEDSEEEKLRKLNEKNYNFRVQTHIKDSVHLAMLLHSKYSAPLSEPLPYKKALEFADLLQKAYKGQLESISINPHMKEEQREKKLNNGKSVAQCFPLRVKTIEVPKKLKDLPPGSGIPVVIAPKQFIVSLAEKKIAQRYEYIVETKGPALKALDKQPIEGFSCDVTLQSMRRQGASISLVVQQYIQLLRSLITKAKKSLTQQQNDQQVSLQTTTIIYPESYQKSRSVQKIQKQQEIYSNEMTQIFNKAIEKLGTLKWRDLDRTEKQIIFGVLALVGGWTSPIKCGQPVQVEINNQWVDAIVVDDGLGKKKVSVILEDDDNLQVQKVPVERVRSHQKYEWPFDSPDKIDQEKLCLSIINVYEQVQQNSLSNTAELNQPQMLSERCLLLMVLKVSSQMKWKLENNNQDTFSKFIEILGRITKEQSESFEDKTKVYWEKALIDSWERIIDKSEDKSHDLFVLRDNFLREQGEELKLERKASSVKVQPNLKQQAYQDDDFEQPLSSYLKGLPEPIPKKNQSEAALKMLAYWEKIIIPKIIEFVRTTFKPWEMEFYFEQLRHHLRNADQIRALEDAMVMCERKMPQGCNPPDESYDWSAKMPDECLVDSWALAKFKQQRSSNSHQNQNQGSSMSGETSYPLLNKFIDLGIDEIVVLIKAVDTRDNVVLAEYWDQDAMQVNSLWIPISFLHDLYSPLPPRAIGYTMKTLKKAFELNTLMVDKVYARQTLIQFFHAMQTQDNKQSVIKLPSADIKLQEVISWSVWERFSNDPVNGWIKSVSYALPLQNKEKTEGKDTIDSEQVSKITTSTTGHIKLQEIVEEAADSIIMDQLTQESQSSSQDNNEVSTLDLITSLFEKSLNNLNDQSVETLKSQDTKTIDEIVEWCIMSWHQTAVCISQDRVVFDLCQEYDNFINSEATKNDDSHQNGQLLPLHEIIPANQNKAQSAISTLLMFKKSGVLLTPTSKIQFYSDANKVNLVSQISAGSEGKKDLAPLLLNYGQIWVSVDPGTTALLPKHIQSEQKSSLPCAMVQIPNSWTVCCWLTETLSSAMLNLAAKFAPKFTLDVFQKLIGALTAFYKDAKAPSMLNSLVFSLLSRLIRKLRFIYQQEEQLNLLQRVDSKGEDHLKKLFVSMSLIESILSELLVHKQQEESNLQIVQDSVELLLTIMLPIAKGQRIDSYKDLIDSSKLHLPDWMEPLLKVSYFMHFFSSEAQLSTDLLREVYEGTRLTHDQLDQILLIQGIPSDEEKYSREWLKSQFLTILKKHGARILNPSTDLVFPAPSQVVIIVDGFDHIELAKDEEDIDLVKENESEPEEEKKVEEPKVQEWDCSVCTFINPISIGACDACTSPRPPMNEIMAAFQAKLNVDKQETQIKEDSQTQQKKSEYLLRLEKVAQELSKVIKREEQRVIQEKKRQIDEEKKLKEEQERKDKDEQEKLAKEKYHEDELKKKQDQQQAKKKQQRKVEKNVQEQNQMQIVSDKQQKDMKSIFESLVLEGEQHLLPQERLKEARDDNWESGGQYEEEEEDDESEEVKKEKTRAKLIEMGMDPAIVDQDPDLVDALLESLLAEEQMARDQAAKLQAEEEEKERKEKEAAEKQRKRAEEEKVKAEMGEEAYNALKPKYTMLGVKVGRASIFEDISCSRPVFKVLKDRLSDTQDDGNFQFSPRVQAVLQQIYDNFQTYQATELPALPDSQLLQEFDFTRESIKESSIEEFLGKCAMLVEADVTAFMTLLESQGYDFWLERVTYPTFTPEEGSQKASGIQQPNLQILEKLKTFIEIDMCKESKAVLYLTPTSLRLLTKTHPQTLMNPQTKENEQSINYYDDSLMATSYPEIYEKLSLADVRYLWSLLRTFNKYLAPSQQLGTIQGAISTSVPLTFSAYMSFTRNLGLITDISQVYGRRFVAQLVSMNVKFDLRHLILEKTAVTREHAPRLMFERLKLAHRNREYEEGGEDNGLNQSSKRGLDIESSPEQQSEQTAKAKDQKKQMDFMFIQAYEQIKDMDLSLLRPKKPQGAEPHLSFHVVFRGEHVVGEGGPYRQFFTDISQELQPVNIGKNPNQKALNLLWPSPNTRGGSSIGLGKFVISPSKNTSQDLSLFEFLGILMGVCIRTGAHLNLDLPQFVWKQLVGQRLGSEDVIEIDLGFWKLMGFMLSATKKLYEESIFETWSVTLSDETIVELRENGKEQRVAFEDRVEYIREALETRLKECSLQCDAIKRGISQIIPQSLLNMVTYKELETWVCGKCIIDVDLLKRHTKYGGDKKTTILTEESRRIKWFWEVLREFSEEDKQKFIKFCWGQQRLPANDEEFERRQVRFMIKPAMKNTHGDGALPKADTCFFNLELPDYSSKEVMKQRILLAIHTDSDSMNAEAEHAASMNNADDGMREDLNQSYDSQY